MNRLGHRFHRSNSEWLFAANLGVLPLFLLVQGLSVSELLRGSSSVPGENVQGKAGLHVHAFNIFALSNFSVHLIRRIGTGRNKSTINSSTN